MLKIALTKGRLEKSTVALFEKMGLDVSAFENKGRKLILPVGDDITVVLAKAPDVITYVEHGVCDIGVVGKDTIFERGGAFYEVLDLGFGKCRFALAVPEGADFYDGYDVKRLASKYPHVTRDYFARKGMDVDIIKIEGSVELAPLLGLVDGIVDLVETGNTLRENGLVAIEDVMQVSARLIVNVVSMKLKKDEINTLIDKIERLKEEEA
ncbi:MAG: ATP phosphoribosyltransferase [Peptococcaceae bacterium]|nr:ATP phosphoribosyltransferase [Peptococcaceae bacterium]MEE0207207.1 ATP phosphoribosyltransferase [Peptococcaceae bacterium]